MKTMRNTARGQRGFTLIELVMVIVILGILAAVAIPRFSDITDEAAAAAAQGVLGGTNSACMTVFAEHRVNSATTGLADSFDDVLTTYPPSGWTASQNDTILSRTQGDTTYTLTLTAETVTAPCSVVLTQ